MKSRAMAAGCLILIPLTFVLRYSVLPYETLDYKDWISVWLQSLRDNGAWKGLGQEIWSCNYNVPYLYFLALISLSDISSVLLVKLVSIFFDIVLAWGTMRLVGVLTGNNPSKKLLTFIVVLWLPSVVLNGSLWGQCDCIYASFAVLAVYYALDDKPCLSVAAIALSISFKLQGIFLLPVYFIFLLSGRIKFRHIFIFPVVYIVSILPAVLAGRDFTELLTLYLRNTSTIGDGLNYNSSSIYALFNFNSLPNKTASLIGIVLVFFFCSFLFVWFSIRLKQCNLYSLFGACVLFCIGVPFFLPHMHDRYFFIADILTVALAVSSPAYTPVAICVSFGSLLGYHAYLKTRYLLPMRYGSIAMAAALGLAFLYTALSMREPDTMPQNEIPAETTE